MTDSAQSFENKVEILEKYDKLMQHDKSDIHRHLAHQLRHELHEQHRSPDAKEKLHEALIIILTHI